MNENQLATKVKALRKKNGLSQEALAQMAGLSLRTIQRIENDHTNPSGDSLKRLSTALNVSPEYFLEKEPNENTSFLLTLAFSPVLCILNPFLAFVSPLLLWSLKKKHIKGVNQLGLKVLAIQAIWFSLYFVFRTINFLRLKTIMEEKHVFIGNEWDAFLTDVETQSYLKTFFVIANILIIFYISFKTYRNNQLDNSNLTV